MSHVEDVHNYEQLYVITMLPNMPCYLLQQSVSLQIKVDPS